MATDISIAELPALSAGSIQGDDLLVAVDVHDLSSSTGTTKNIAIRDLDTKNATFNVLNYGVDRSGVIDATGVVQGLLTTAGVTGGTVIVPPDTTLAISGTGLSVPTGVDFLMMGNAVLVYTGTGVCVTLNQVVGGQYDLSIRRSSVQWHDNTTDTTSEGLRIRNCTFSSINLRSVTGFWKGINFYGDSASVGTQGVTLRLGYTDSCKLGIAATAITSGFANQNTIIGGNTILESSDLVSGNPVSGSKFVDLSTAGNGWTFLGVDFQGTNCQENVTVLGASHCFVGCRWENVRKVNFLAGSFGNQVIGGYQNPGFFDGTVWLDSGKLNTLVGGYPAGGSTFNGYGTVAGANSIPALTLRGASGNASLVEEIRDAANTVSLRMQSDGKLLGYPSAGSTFPTTEYDFRAGTFYAGDGTVAPSVVFGLNNNTVFNVKNFGALGDGTTDDTAAIQAAITAAQALIPTVNVYAPVAPVVYIPYGTYRLTATLTITKPIKLAGAGSEQCLLTPVTANLPCIKVNLTTAQSTYVTFEITGLGIRGLNPFNSYVTQDAADGILVTGTSDVTSYIHHNRIVSMTGHGINLANFGNSHGVTWNVIEQCCKDGIHVDGQYNTNFWVEHNIVRENRRGMAVQNTTGTGSGFLSTGRILNNLFESNNGGTTGAIGSVDRPSIGVFLSKAQWILMEGNYSENQWNDWLFNDNISFCTLSRNTFLFANSLSLVQTYGGPPANQAGLYVGSGTNAYNNIEGNVFGVQPVQPGGVTNTNWGTGTFGASYEHVTDTSGVNRYLFNITQLPSNGSVLITNPSSRHTILNDEADPGDGAGRAIHWLRAFKSQEDYANFTITKTANQRLVSALSNGSYFDVVQFTDGNVARRYTRQVQQGPAGALTTFENVNPLGILQQVWTDGAALQTVWTYGTAAPTTGTHRQGEIVLQSAPTSGGFIGFVCTSAGTPGTWKTWGPIS